MSPFLWTPPPPRAGPGPDFRYTIFSGGRGFLHFSLNTLFGLPSPLQFSYYSTHFFRVAVTVAFAFYLHKLFGWPGFCILLTHTFRVAGVCISPTHTFGAILKQNWEKWIQSWNIFRAARALLLKQSIRKWGIFWNISRPARALFPKQSIRKWCTYLKSFRAARALFLKQSIRKWGIYWKVSALRARPLSSDGKIRGTKNVRPNI